MERRKTQKHLVKEKSRYVTLQRQGNSLDEESVSTDPDFDFKNRSVVPKKAPKVKKEKVQKNIKQYYEKELDEESKGKLSEGIKAAETRPITAAVKVKSKPKAKKSSAYDYEFTKALLGKIEPGPIKPRAQFKLREVCKANKYELSMKDFKDERIQLGSGKFGDVYLVHCTLNDQKYALKILDKEKVQATGYDRHILREKEISMMLEHPNIVRLESYFQDSDF
jgi:hypothetical protein